MSDKLGVAVAIIVLVIIGVLVANAVCDECIFDWPAGGVGGGGSSVTTQKTGFNWLPALMLLIPLVIMAYLCKASDWLGKWSWSRLREGIIKGLLRTKRLTS